MSTQDILLKHVCPGVGAGVALLLFASPFPAVWRCNKAKCLGDLNALPFAAMAINCAAWVFYAMLLEDYYIYFGNLPGMLLGMFYVLTCYKFSKEAAQDLLRNLIMFSIFLYWLMGLVGMAAKLDTAATKTLWGATCVSVLGVYYTAPLSSVAKVFAERDSSSLHWPLCTMNVINGLLWFAYGLAIKDWFVCLPNGIGAGFNMVCLALCFLFPATSRKQQQQQQPGQVLDEINPAANWGALRLQSIVQRPGEVPLASGGAAAGGGFFDLTQLRWRTGRAASFRAGSFLRLLSSSQQCRPDLGQGTAVGAESAVANIPDAAAKVVVAGVDQHELVHGGGLGTKADVGDVEQAHVVADARRGG